MLCVAINNRDSLDSVARWRTEIRQVCNEAPIMLVGTKSDLRTVTAEPITLQDLKNKSDEMGLQAVVETSSKEWRDHNVNKAFHNAIRLGYYNRYPHEMQ